MISLCPLVGPFLSSEESLLPLKLCRRLWFSIPHLCASSPRVAVRLAGLGIDEARWTRDR